MTVTATEWKWRRWRLREGEFAPPWDGPRPAEFPRLIPAAWWARLTLFLARRKLTGAPQPYTGIYSKPGALWRQSDSEDLARAHRAGLRWGLLQLGGDDWTLLRSRFQQLSLPWGYWAHVRTVHQLRALLLASVDQQTPLVGINVEKELETDLSPDVIRAMVDEYRYQGQVCTILYGWVQNSVDCTPIGHWPSLHEIFPQDSADLWRPLRTTQHCLDHARLRGLKHPIPLYGCYPMSRAQHDRIRLTSPDPPPVFPDGAPAIPAQPAWYPNMPHCIYTADDIGDRFEDWL